MTKLTQKAGRDFIAEPGHPVRVGGSQARDLSSPTSRGIAPPDALVRRWGVGR